MLWLIRYLKGYLIIKIEGKSGEQILNRASANGINIWNTYYTDGCIFGNISANKFCKLFCLRHGLNCKIEIINRNGLLFGAKKYKRRFGLLVGIIAFFAIIITLSNFIWIINFSGNESISSKELLNACKNIGVKEGIAKNKIHHKYDAQKLQLAHGKIAWCSFNIEGCVLTVNISEIKQNKETENKTPSNIKSIISGRIKKIDVTSGNVLIKVGDYVSTGDLLVSGIIENNSGIHFVHSEGEIIAETERVFSAEGKYSQVLLVPVSKQLNKYTIKFFNFEFPLFLGNVRGDFEYECDITDLSVFNKRIPLSIATQKYIMLQQEKISYDKETLQNILCEEIQKQVLGFNFINSVEKSTEIISTETGLLLKITYLCEENIAQQNAILLGKPN